MLWRQLLASCLATYAMIGASAWAQTQPVAANMVTEFKGQLKSVQRGVLIVSREDGAEVMIQPPEDIAAFNFVAEAKPAFLQRGTMVRFSGVFGPGGQPLAPIEKVEIFQPVAVQKLVGRLRERYVPGVYPERGGQQGAQAMAKYNIVGGLMAIAPTGLMAVQAGKTPVRVPLSKDVKFELRFNNLSLAQEGDPVSVAGFYEPPDDTKVRASRVTITTDRVYGEPIEQPAKPSRRRGRTRENPADAGKEAANAGKEGAANAGKEGAANAGKEGAANAGKEGDGKEGAGQQEGLQGNRENGKELAPQGGREG